MQSNELLVYLVDDDEDDRFLFSDALKRSNSNIHLKMFQEASEVLDHLKTTEAIPDVIFIDLNMPLINGEELLEKIKSGPNNRDIPIIVYSTSYNPRKAQSVLEKGGSLLLKKPASFKELQKKIQESINTVLKSNSPIQDSTNENKLA
ncbi:MAG: response regulator [Flavobacteriaceae bacterium]|nr:response regulator [Flavobacteriaceae bacterium]